MCSLHLCTEAFKTRLGNTPWAGPSLCRKSDHGLSRIPSSMNFHPICVAENLIPHVHVHMDVPVLVIISPQSIGAIWYQCVPLTRTDRDESGNKPSKNFPFQISINESSAFHLEEEISSVICLTNFMNLGFFLHNCSLDLGAGKKGQKLWKGEEPEMNHWEE